MTSQFAAQFPDAAEAEEALNAKNPVYALETAAFDCGRSFITYSHLERLLRSAWAHGVLRACGDNVSLASRETHLHRNTLSRMLHAMDEKENPNVS